MPQRIKERYTLLEVVGQGGMGTVYKALDTKVGRYVSIRTLRDMPNEAALKTFRQEITVLARLDHPNLVEITEVGEFGEKGNKKLYLVMPFLKGRSLDRVLAQKNERLTIERCARIIIQACQGLHAAHEGNLIHGDVKPSNIFILENDGVKLIDLGVARMADVKSSIGHRGTRLYRSPEHVDDKGLTRRSDIFSLGVVFYELLAKKHPFEGETLEEVKHAIRYTKPPLASMYNPSVGDSICFTIQKALSKDPRNRFATAKDFADNLEKALRNEPIDYFDPAKIQPRLEKATAALQKDDVLLTKEILDDVEREGYWHPEIDRLRTDIEQMEKKSKIGQLLENVQKHLAVHEHTLALQGLHELLELDPNHEAAKELKINIEAQLKRRSIENWLNLARTHAANHDFENARQALQDVYHRSPGHATADEILNDINRKEEEFKRLSRIKEELYKKSLEDFRAGHLGDALHKAEELIKLDKLNKKESATYTNHYNQVRSAYEALARKYDEAKRLLNEKNFGQALMLCNEILAQNLNNLQFKILKQEIEDKRRQDRSAYIAKIDCEADGEPDLSRKIQILEDGLKRYPDELRFLEALKVAREKKELVDSIVAKAKACEERKEFVEAISQLEIIKVIYADHPTLDLEIDRLRKRREAQMRQEEKTRILESIDQDLSEGLFEKALEPIATALREFPEDPELEQLKSEAEQGLARKKKALDLLAQGQAHRRSQRYDDAMQVLEEASTLDAKNLEVKAARVDCMLFMAELVLSTNWKEAERLLERVLTIDENNEPAKSLRLVVQDKKQEEAISRLMARARVLRSQGQLDAAEQVLREGLKQYPDEQRIVQMLGGLNKARDEQRRAEAVCRAEDLAEKLVSEKRFKEAEEAIGETLRKYPDDSELLSGLTRVREARQASQTEEELSTIKDTIRAVEGKKDLPGPNPALSALKEAPVKHPDKPDLLEGRGVPEKETDERLLKVEWYKKEAEKRIQRGDTKTALNLIGKGLELDPQNQPLFALKKRIAKKRRSMYGKAALAVGGLAVLVAVVLAIRVTIKRHSPQAVEALIKSVPSGAAIFMDGQDTGKKTDAVIPINLYGKDARQITLTLKLEKHKELVTSLPLRATQKSLELEYTLEKQEETDIVSRELSETYGKAEQAYRGERFVRPAGNNALEFAKRVMEMDPENQGGYKDKALKLIEKMKNDLREERAGLPAAEKGTEKELELLEDMTALDPDDSKLKTEIESFRKRVDNLKSQIRKAISKKIILPPDQGNAWDLLERLSKKFPTREKTYVWSIKRKEVLPKVRALARQKCKTPSEDCTAYLTWALNSFTNDSDLKMIEATVIRMNEADKRKREADEAAAEKAGKTAEATRREGYRLARLQADKRFYDKEYQRAVDEYEALKTRFPDLFSKDAETNDKLAKARAALSRQPKPDQPSSQIFSYELSHVHRVGRDCKGALSVNATGMAYKSKTSANRCDFDSTYDGIEGPSPRGNDQLCFTVKNSKRNNYCFKLKEKDLKDLENKTKEFSAEKR